VKGKWNGTKENIFNGLIPSESISFNFIVINAGGVDHRHLIKTTAILYIKQKHH